eukprot:15477157-Alexandrium_andersonii.AAC.1
MPKQLSDMLMAGNRLRLGGLHARAHGVQGMHCLGYGLLVGLNQFLMCASEWLPQTCGTLKVISKDASEGMLMYGGHALYPWIHHEGQQRHAPWASLRNGAHSPMGGSHPRGVAVDNCHPFSVRYVGCQHPWRHASGSRQS